MLRIHPAARVDAAALRGKLASAIAADRVSITVDGKYATIELRGVTPATLATDAQAVKEMASALGTHVELVGLDVETDVTNEPNRAQSTPMLRLLMRAPLENALFIGDAPRPPLPATGYRELSHGVAQLIVHFRSCPACQAEHAIFHYPKGHAQDRDDVTFTCLACARCECFAVGIPELSRYRIDLVDRLSPELARVARRARRARRGGVADPRRVAGTILGVVLGVVIVVVLLAFAR